jgi:hypothetical protein
MKGNPALTTDNDAYSSPQVVRSMAYIRQPTIQSLAYKGWFVGYVTKLYQLISAKWYHSANLKDWRGSGRDLFQDIIATFVWSD